MIVTDRLEGDYQTTTSDNDNSNNNAQPVPEV
jgi:hypothetical protein